MRRFIARLLGLWVCTRSDRERSGGHWFKLRDESGGLVAEYWSKAKPDPEKLWLSVIAEERYPSRMESEI